MKKSLISMATLLACLSGQVQAQEALTFWNTSGYSFGGWNTTTQINDGLGGSIGIKYSVNPGFSTWNWTPGNGPSPYGSVNDYAGTNSFGGGDLQGFTSVNGVNAVRSQVTRFNNASQIQYNVDLDFSNYKGSATGGTDGVAGANTLIGLSDYYAGNRYADTNITITAYGADNAVVSTAGWTLLNGDAVGTWYTGGLLNSANVKQTFSGGVLQGTGTIAAGGAANADKLDTVLGLLRLDGTVGIKSVHLTFNTQSLGGILIDNSALYVASLVPGTPTIEHVAITTPVPEPTSTALALAGVAVASMAVRRRRNTA